MFICIFIISVITFVQHFIYSIYAFSLNWGWFVFQECVSRLCARDHGFVRALYLVCVDHLMFWISSCLLWFLVVKLIQAVSQSFSHAIALPIFMWLNELGPSLSGKVLTAVRSLMLSGSGQPAEECSNAPTGNDFSSGATGLIVPVYAFTAFLWCLAAKFGR